VHTLLRLGLSEVTPLMPQDFSDDPRAPVRRKVHFSTIPPNTTFVPEIKAFHPVGHEISEGVIEFVNGSVSRRASPGAFDLQGL